MSHGLCHSCHFLNDTEVICAEFIPEAVVIQSHGHKDILTALMPKEL